MSVKPFLLLKIWYVLRSLYTGGWVSLDVNICQRSLPTAACRYIGCCSVNNMPASTPHAVRNGTTNKFELMWLEAKPGGVNISKKLRSLPLTVTPKFLSSDLCVWFTSWFFGFFFFMLYFVEFWPQTLEQSCFVNYTKYATFLCV